MKNLLLIIFSTVITLLIWEALWPQVVSPEPIDERILEKTITLIDTNDIELLKEEILPAYE